jgi:hypothetical protein
MTGRMKEAYESPIMEIITVVASDIVTASQPELEDLMNGTEVIDIDEMF